MSLAHKTVFLECPDGSKVVNMAWAINSVYVLPHRDDRKKKTNPMQWMYLIEHKQTWAIAGPRIKKVDSLGIEERRDQIRFPLSTCLWIKHAPPLFLNALIAVMKWEMESKKVEDGFSLHQMWDLSFLTLLFHTCKWEDGERASARSLSLLHSCENLSCATLCSFGEGCIQMWWINPSIRAYTAKQSRTT